MQPARLCWLPSGNTAEEVSEKFWPSERLFFRPCGNNFTEASHEGRERAEAVCLIERQTKRCSRMRAKVKRPPFSRSTNAIVNQSIASLIACSAQPRSRKT